MDDIIELFFFDGKYEYDGTYRLPITGREILKELHERGIPYSDIPIPPDKYYLVKLGSGSEQPMDLDDSITNQGVKNRDLLMVISIAKWEAESKSG